MDEYMNKTLNLVSKSLKSDDIPVAAMIIENEKIISSAYNTKYKCNDVTSHAEILAIRKACKRKKTTYLNNCILYVTLEPCMMCSSAIIQSHIKKVIYCVKSPKYGYLLKCAKENKIECIQMYSEEYEQLLKKFFRDKR